MICSYRPRGEALSCTDTLDPEAPWIDLVQPDAEERARVSELVGLDLPSLADQEEIEHSSRLYLEHGVPVMTALLTVRTDAGAVETAPVTFIPTRDRLVTIRHQPHGAFRAFHDHPDRSSLGVGSALRIQVGLIEAVVDRLADFTEHVGREIDLMTRAAFQFGEGPAKDHEAALRDIGRQDTVVMQIRESLTSLDRLLGFLQPTLGKSGDADEARRAIKSAQRDVRTISEQATFLTSKTALLLEATLGMISIEQNEIGKIFSVVATVFLPPTLIASIFGMNFVVMPILEWRYGYYACLALMVLTAAAPLLWFKRKGWL
ncbi:magnesium transporter CorA family protein [Citreimonas salinaria]|uniref:Magnesium transport protein CorA n=1 Tax=Citreimonas salinaria TaxID=321339 RepID=A0A1H3ITP4_9RHOB|nr:magnesium transporter CorA family protein [Citreimonas salinaria]SDY30705.1 magnesium transporter [Citreimonas salinaria]